MNEQQLVWALNERYKAPEYSLLPQVRNGTGYQRRARTADAIAMSLYPLRGLEMHGFEIKVSRSDWLRELKDPEKAEELCRYCGRWWIVAGDGKVVSDGELPPTWGLLVPRGKSLMAKVEAPKLDAQPLTRVFFAALMRKASLVVTPQAVIDEAVQKAVQGLQETMKETARINLESATRDFQWLKKSVKEFEEKSGIRITHYNGGNIGEIVGMLERGGLRSVEGDLIQLRNLTSRMTQRIDDQLKLISGQNNKEKDEDHRTD
jgi:hypothetical protein